MFGSSRDGGVEGSEECGCATVRLPDDGQDDSWGWWGFGCASVQSPDYGQVNSWG